MDTDLVIRAQDGDKGAYGLVVTEVADRYLAVARRILRDIDLAEDATQQALLAIWQDLPQLRDPALFDAWSYRLLDHRTVVVLHHYLDLPLERVAEICGIPVGTAHSRLHHAMRVLHSSSGRPTSPLAGRRPSTSWSPSVRTSVAIRAASSAGTRRGGVRFGGARTRATRSSSSSRAPR